MILVGRDLSPFTRRVLVSMALLDVSCERREFSTTDDFQDILGFNPAGRVPALRTDDGETLVDSSAILDYLDEQAGDDRALLPKRGEDRRRSLQSISQALSATEKAVSSFYERRMKAEDRRDPKWVERCENQSRGALQEVERSAPAEGWFLGDKISQADITAAVAYDFIGFVCPGVTDDAKYPKLAAWRDRMAAEPAFQASSLDKYRT